MGIKTFSGFWRNLLNNFMDKEDKIILSYFSGIGDILQFSTLPARFTELGYKVYVSDQSLFRNPEIETLVYDLNPFILGKVKAPPNCGDGANIKLEHKTGSFIGDWELAHGLEPRGKYPEIYYKPKFDRLVSDKILMDITSISGKNIYDPQILKEFLHRNYTGNNILTCCFQSDMCSHILSMDEYDAIHVPNIFYYCNLIHSCKKLVTLHSGAMVMASALKKYGELDVDCLVTYHPIHTLGFINHHHFYDNINYIWI